MMKTSESKTVIFLGQEISIADRFPLGGEAARLIGIVTCPQCIQGVELYPFMYQTCPECSHEWSQGLWYVPINSITTKYKVGDVISLSQRQVEIVAIEGTRLICHDEPQSPTQELFDIEQRFCPKCESLNSYQMHNDCDRS
jgi:Zn finger protein HypA/HybF involved in hydrogenase expression